ncbi:ATP-binding protein [Stigmatella sp. ncwal1]|uniref:histidine kinase n=1 Tax=Stigmatella ashevillensis TaxID=2995309 RepID=A0ABT5DG94_9BACT|nr:ATP-binding protein [Stigmatella ashevillena]MDC0712694.1 ATP-binding protein [Stigmatella ashevillena]
MSQPLVLLVATPSPGRTLQALALESQGWRVQQEDSVARLAEPRERPDVLVLEGGLPLNGEALATQGLATVVLASSVERERLKQRGVQASFLDWPASLGEVVEGVRAVLPPGKKELQEGPPPITVLIADDDPLSRKLLQLHLTPFRFEVVTAPNGQAALELARRRRPKVVIADVLMPGLDGFRLCLALRKDPRLANVPVLLTHVGAPDELDLRMAQNVGANGFVRRTQEGEEVLGALLRALHSEGPAAAPLDQGLLCEEHLHGMVRRLERQVGLLARAERSARESEERYRLVVAGSYDGVWDWDLRHDTLWCSPRLLELLGRRTEDFPGTYDAFIAWVHPEDRTRVEAAMVAHLEEGTPYDVSVRLRHADGSYHACVSRGQAMRDEHGRPVRMAGIINDVTEQLRLFRETQEAVRTRDEFLSVAAHELRTPLTALRLRLQGVNAAMQADTPTSPERISQALGSADRQVQRLTGLVDTLLDVSQLQSHAPLLQLEQVDLAAVVREAVARSELEASRAGCRLVMSPMPSTLGRWDPVRLAQVVRHLLANAMKFGPGKPVEVTLEARVDAAVLKVRDHGIGIEPERLDTLFQRFERAVPVRHYGGLGLGLYRVRRIVEAHGGAVTVDSVLGEGATFHVSLPREGPAVANTRI